MVSEQRNERSEGEGVWRHTGREFQAEVLKDCGFFSHLHVLSPSLSTPLPCYLNEAICHTLSCPRARPCSKNLRQLQLIVSGELRSVVQQSTRKLVLLTPMAGGSGPSPS